MQNPFPGMNPYLERHWPDIHQAVVTYARDQLTPRLPRDLRARMNERVFVEEDQIFERKIYPDVRVVERKHLAPMAVQPEAEVAGTEPVLVEIESEPIREGFIEIVEAGSRERVITIIEFLSPANKFPGSGREQYHRKQRECRESHTSLVEIDLLRDGPRAMAIPERWVPSRCQTPYRVSVMRGWAPTKFEVYAAPLRRRLPDIRVPLRENETYVVLELQPLIDQAYQNGGYDDIDYKLPPEPPLEGEDAVWADELLKNCGLR